MGLMSTISKANIIDNLVSDVELSKKDARLVVESFFKCITTSLITGANVRISGFGNFILRDKGSRPGRNPKTGEDVPVSARRVVTFRTGMKLKEKVYNAHKKSVN